MDDQRKAAIREQLNAVHDWPSVFIFKFILAPDPEKMTTLRGVFDESAEFSTRESRNGNYISVTVKEMVLEADTVFERYAGASVIEGIIAL